MSEFTEQTLTYLILLCFQSLVLAPLIPVKMAEPVPIRFHHLHAHVTLVIRVQLAWMQVMLIIYV